MRVPEVMGKQTRQTHAEWEQEAQEYADLKRRVFDAFASIELATQQFMILPRSREAALVVTKLQEAMFWASQMPAAPEPPPEPERDPEEQNPDSDEEGDEDA